MLIKHNERTTRKPCFCHGIVGHYWCHDTDVTTRPDGTSYDYCEDCKVTGKMVQAEANDVTKRIPVGHEIPEAHRHDRDSKATPAPTPASMPNARPAEPKDATIPMGANAAIDAAANQASAAPGDMNAMMQAFQTLSSAFGPKIDTETVRAMVKDEFKATVFPTRTVVVNPDGDVITGDIPDTTHEALADILIDISASRTSPTPMSVLMVGPAGSGKSTLARNAASALNLKYGEISLNPMLPVTNLLGYLNATGTYVRTVFRDLWENGGLFLADELDNGHPSTLATLNAALAAKAGTGIAFPDGMVDRHKDFIFMASANTYGRGPDRIYVGRQQLDAATMDRFVVEEINYDESLEHQICLNTGYDANKVAEVLRYVRALRKNAVSKKMTILVTPRSSVFMCTLLHAGKKFKSVEASSLRRGISDADWSKLQDGVVPPRV